MTASASVARKERSDFYVYVHRRATDGTVFYVGKGRKYRAFDRCKRNVKWYAVETECGFTVEIIRSEMREFDALKYEAELIAHYGRDNLCNLSTGGGACGYEVSDEQRQKTSERFKNIVRTPEWYQKVAAKLRQQTIPPDMRARISAKLKGRKLSPETCAKMSASRMGRKRTPQEIESCKRSWTPERKAANSVRLVQHWLRPVICVETGQRFESLKAAGEWLATFSSFKSHLKIGSVCRGERQKAYGYRWRYAD